MKSSFKYTVYCHPTEIIDPDFKKEREEGRGKGGREEGEGREEGKEKET